MSGGGGEEEKAHVYIQTIPWSVTIMALDADQLARTGLLMATMNLSVSYNHKHLCYIMLFCFEIIHFISVFDMFLYMFPTDCGVIH